MPLKKFKPQNNLKISTQSLGKAFSSEALNNPCFERLLPHVFSPDSRHHSPPKWWRRQCQCERHCRLHWWRLQTCSAELHHLVLLRCKRERERRIILRQIMRKVWEEERVGAHVWLPHFSVFHSTHSHFSVFLFAVFTAYSLSVSPDNAIFLILGEIRSPECGHREHAVNQSWHHIK